MAKPIRLGAFLLGLICAGLGCYGSWEFALKLELGTVTYLVLAAPVIAAAAAMIPPIAEATWRGGQYLKSLLWWLVLVPAGAVVFFSAAERVHVAKAVRKPNVTPVAVSPLVPRQHSPRPKASWIRREPMPTVLAVRSSVVPIAGPSSQRRRRRKLTLWLRDRRSSLLRARPLRTALYRLPCGSCPQPSTSWPLWPCGRPYQAVAASRQRCARRHRASGVAINLA
jgi:hypothetical protein